MTIVTKVGGGGGGAGGAPLKHGTGSPEGVVTSTGYLYVDDNTGLIYTNPVVGATTGWVIFQISPAF